MNGILILTMGGISGYLGASLGIVPSLLLLLLLSAYDIIAVFGTKHMVTLAKGAKGKIPMLSVPLKERFLGIGTGDLALPSVFTVSILREYSQNLPLVMITVLGGLIGLISLFFYILKREKVTLPALPPITIGLVIGFLVGLVMLE
jgi:presenilin-like A22 family membrane protease